MGCGGGIQDGMPDAALLPLTPEQKQQQDDLVAKEHTAAKARKTDAEAKGPAKAKTNEP
jgi:hypothetical protein